MAGAKPLSKPMLGYCQLDPQEKKNFSKILIKIQNFSFTKMYLKIASGKWRLFWRGFYVLNLVLYITLQTKQKEAMLIFTGPSVNIAAISLDKLSEFWVFSKR